MSLYNGMDLSAAATLGVYARHFGAASKGPIANLIASFGLIHDAIRIAISRRYIIAVMTKRV